MGGNGTLMQRCFDILFAGIALAVLSPLLLPLAILLRLTGEGEIFYVQKRIGLHGEPFNLIKFATMLKNSPSLGTGTVTIRNDPRVLPLGRFLRKSKINELPQLINVIMGDMSLIGPRPQTRRCFEAFPPAIQPVIVQARPGLSGFGSLVFRNEQEIMASADDADRLYDEVIMPYKGEVESWYVSRSGLPLYFAVIALTCWLILFPRSQAVWRLFPSLPRPPAELVQQL